MSPDYQLCLGRVSSHSSLDSSHELFSRGASSKQNNKKINSHLIHFPFLSMNRKAQASCIMDCFFHHPFRISRRGLALSDFWQTMPVGSRDLVSSSSVCLIDVRVGCLCLRVVCVLVELWCCRLNHSEDKNTMTLLTCNVKYSIQWRFVTERLL